MKSTFLTCALVMLAFVSGMAQPVYNSCGNGPQIGTTLVGYSHRCDTVGVTEGPAGAMVVWDFSNLTDLSFNQLYRPYLDPDSTQGGVYYPDGEVSWYEGAGYSYYSYQPTAVNYYGNYNGPQLCSIYSDPAIKLQCPMTFGSSFVDVSEATQCGSGNLTGSTSVRYDAYGTLILPYGMIQNVMRFHTLDTLFDSGFMVTFDTYDWWDSTSQIPLLTISDLWYTESNVMKRVYYPQATSILASMGNHLPSPAVAAYPNPVHDHLRLETPSEWLGGRFGLYSSTGQLIATTELNDLHLTVDVSTLASGFYFYRVTDSASLLLQTGKIVVE